jgi:hypothetical protein
MKQLYIHAYVLHPLGGAKAELTISIGPGCGSSFAPSQSGHAPSRPTKQAASRMHRTWVGPHAAS